MTNGKVVDIGGVRETMRAALIAEREDAWKTTRGLIEQAEWDASATRTLHEHRDFAGCKERVAAALVNLARLAAALDHESGIPEDGEDG